MSYLSGISSDDPLELVTNDIRNIIHCLHALHLPTKLLTRQSIFTPSLPSVDVISCPYVPGVPSRRNINHLFRYNAQLALPLLAAAAAASARSVRAAFPLLRQEGFSGSLPLFALLWSLVGGNGGAG